MVKWQGRRQSGNVEDRRGAAAAGGAGVVLMLLRLIIGRFGIRGLLVVAVAGAALMLVGVNPLRLIEGGPASAPSQPVDDETSQFVRVILGETEDTWSRIFEAGGADYPEPTLVMFTSGVNSGCGYASAATGPFYCPADQKLYLDESFFQELKQRFEVPGDFPAAYVIAHEVGHHIQTVTGISDKVRAAQQRAKGEAEANAYQVMMELQADCYAGVWAHHADRYGDFLDDGDIEEGLRAAAAIGDDALQRGAGREVTPESFTHGTSEQRQRWFKTGYSTGDVNRCDTFGARSL